MPTGSEKIPDLPPAACAAELAGRFPALFGTDGPIKPIKLRIQADIQQRAAGVFTRKSLSIFLHRHTTSTAYLKALMAAPSRFDLDGAPAGDIADEHREAARVEVERRRALVVERRKAEARAARAPASAPSPGAGSGEGPGQPAPADSPAKPPRPPRPGAAWRAPRQDRPPPREPRPEAPRAPTASKAPSPPPSPHDPASRDRATLLRAWESSPLTKSNFCALKRLPEAEFDALIAQARQERDGR